MSYNLHELPKYVNTAGKITILTAVIGFLSVALVFLFNAGKTELMQVDAQTATTTLTVLNTPPLWDVFAIEESESSTSTPTNSGEVVSWVGTATDQNGAPYFLLVCSTSNEPVPQAAASSGVLGTAPPQCSPTSTIQWAVSTSTVSGNEARAATTTVEGGSFGERNEWYAWVCDDDPVNPRCNNTFSTGTSTATGSSPFHMNRRPVLTNAFNDGPIDPGATLNFLSTSSDPDVIGGEDEIFLVACNADTYSTTTNDCGGDTLATTSIPGPFDNASSSYTLASIVQDDVYSAFAYLYDEHGHEASGGDHGSSVDFTVNNVAPEVKPGSINFGTSTLVVAPAVETTGFELTFETQDANSCTNATGPSGNTDEMQDYIATIFRSGFGTTTCDGTGANYNPNYCYDSESPSFGISCTASTTSCSPTDGTDPDIEWSCTFPLWFVADPTDLDSPNPGEVWAAAVTGIDDNFATGTLATTSNPGATAELRSVPAIALLDGEIPYGALEPGDDTGTLRASTSIQNVGNTGLDQELLGDPMCEQYPSLGFCPNSSTSTIPESEQQFADSELSYGSGTALSSTTAQELELDVASTTATSSPTEGTTYWGIAVPSSIQLAGSYTGLNTFFGIIAETVDW